MRKRIAVILMALAFILPLSFVFSACGKEDAKVKSFSVELVNSSYTMTENTITIPYGGKVSLGENNFKVTATLEDDKTAVISAKTAEKAGYEIASTIPDDAKTPIGEYTLTFSHADTEHKVVITIKVVKGNVDMSGVAWNYTSPYTYNKQDRTVSITGLPAGVSVSYSGERTKKYVGEYTVTASFTHEDAENYNPIQDMVLTWRINKANIVISNLTLAEYTYAGTEKEAVITSQLPNDVTATITGEKEGVSAGGYDVTINFTYTGTDSANYNPISPVTKTWRINKAPLTVTAKDQALTYGENVQATAGLEDVAITGFVNGETTSVLGGTLDLDYDDYETIKNAGNYDITPSGLTAANYEINYVKGELAVAKKALTITADDKSITYGGAFNLKDVTPAGFVYDDDLTDLGGTLVFNNGGYNVGSSVGTYTLTPSGLTSSNYEISFVEGTLTVGKKDLTLKPIDVHISYLENATDNGVTPTGLIAGDTVAMLGTVNFDFGGYTSGSPVGEYKITITEIIPTQNSKMGNYNINIEEKGTLYVSKIDVPVNVSGIALLNPSTTYDGTNKNALISVDPSTIPTDITVESVEVSDKTPINADTYTIVIALKYVDQTNYNTMDDITRTFTIEKATVEGFDDVGLKADSFIYNGTDKTITEAMLENIPVGADFDSFVSGETGKNVDTYTVRVKLVCADTTNYENFGEEIVELTWEITPVTLTLTANNHTITYKDDPSNAGYTLTGFVNGETEATAVDGEVKFSYTYTKGDDANGEYYIIPRFEGDLGNYQILEETTFKGTLTVNPMVINVSTFEWVNAGEHTYTGDEIVISLDTKNAEGVSVGEVVITKGGEPVTEIVDAGTYTVSVTISALNANYVLSIDAVEDATVIVNPKPVDMTNVAWTTELTKTYDGSVFAPEIVGLPNEGITLTRNYFIGSGMSALPIEGGAPTNAGEYSVNAEITALNGNYVLVNYETPIGGVEFVIEKAEIDITGIDWADSSNAYENTGSAIKPVLNVTEIPNATIEYSYKHYEMIEDEYGEHEEWVDVEPIQNGTYDAVAVIIYDSNNYKIMKEGYEWSDTIILNYQIVTDIIEASECDFAWNVETKKNYQGESHEDHQALVVYEGNDISLGLTSSVDKLQIRYQLDGSIVDEVVVSDKGNYNVYATISLKEEFATDYYFEEYNFYLDLRVVVNPFESITIDGQTSDFINFSYLEMFEYGTIIEFITREGYTAVDNEQHTISSIIVGEFDGGLRVYAGELEQGEVVFEKGGFPYFFLNNINVNDKDYDKHEMHNISFMLDENQDSFAINFDQKYITKYGEKLKYYIEYNNTSGEGMSNSNGVISSRPFVVNNAKNVRSVSIDYQKDEQSSEQISYIYVQQFSVLKTITYEYADFDIDTILTGDATKYNSIYLNNAILLSVTATIAEGYDNYTILYLNDEGEPIDYTNLNELTSVNIVVKNGDQVIEERRVNVSLSILSGEVGFSSGSSSSNQKYFVNSSSVSAHIDCENSKLVLSSLYNGVETLNLTNEITDATYTLAVLYNGQTYSYSNTVKFIKSLTIEETVSEEAYQNGVYITNTNTRESYSVSSDRYMSMYDKYTAKNLREFKNEFAYLTYPAKAGLTITNKELVNIDSIPYLRLTFSGEGLEVNTLLINIGVEGLYDSNTGAYFNISSGPNEPELREPVNDIIEIDLSTERLHVMLKNGYASAVLVDTSTTPATVLTQTTGHGYFESSFSFVKLEAGDHYQLIVTATDGTTKEYIIKLTGEYIPVLEVTIGDTVLVQETDPDTNAPTDGSFEFLTLSETEMEFRGAGGVDLLELVETDGDDRYLTISSLRSSMISGASIYNQDGDAILNLTNFKLKVLGDEGAEYVTFYAEAGPVTSTIVIYLSDELPLPEFLRLGYKGATYAQYYSEESGPGKGDFKVSMDMATMTYHFYLYLPTLEGEDALLENITLDDFYCIYDVVWYDGIKGEALTSYSLKLGLFAGETTPCITAMGQLEVEEGMTITIRVTLYFGEEPVVNYPATITVGEENSYDIQLNMMVGDFGDAEMGDNGLDLYIVADPTTITSITITLNRPFDDYSYVVIADGEAFQTAMQAIGSGVQNADYLDTLISEGKAYRATEQNELTMTIPVTFIDGVATIYVAAEGFAGYVPESDEIGMSFVPVLIYASPAEPIE